MRAFRWLAVLGLIVTLAACASAGGTKGDKLYRNQYAWSGAIRWSDFEGAVNLIDPALREKQTPNAVQLERYKQLQVSSYRDVGASSDTEAGTAMRDIEIGVINRHTQAERSLRYREQWRWDAATKNWWITSGLPDFWEGQ